MATSSHVGPALLRELPLLLLSLSLLLVLLMLGLALLISASRFDASGQDFAPQPFAAQLSFNSA